MGLTEDEQAERQTLKEEQKLERDWDRCEKWKHELMERSQSAPLLNGSRSRTDVIDQAHRSSSC